MTELVNANKAAAQMKQDFKCIVKCLKGPDPLHSIAEFLEEAGMDSAADSGLKARSSELTWVMRRLDDHLKQSSGASCSSQSVLLCTRECTSHCLYLLVKRLAHLWRPFLFFLVCFCWQHSNKHVACLCTALALP